MTTPASKLLQPITVGPLELKNRIMFPPLTTGYEERDGSIGERSLAFYERLARGGVSYIVIGDVAPVMTASPTPKLATDAQIPTFKALADAVHKHGAKVALQLFHPEYDVPGVGRMVMGSMAAAKAAQEAKAAGDEETFAAKMAESNEIRNQAYAKLHHDMQHFVNEASVEQLTQIKEAIAASAARAQQAGIDAIEVHGDRLVGSLCSAILNQRTDEYGGSFENRFRFPVEVVQSIKRQAGADFPVSLRYSVVSKTKAWGKGAMPYETDFEEFGRDMAESEKAVKYLEEAGYDMFNCDNGTYDAWYWAHPPQYMPDNCNLEYVEHIKKFTNCPVVCAGRMDPVKAAEEIAAGRLDAVAIARQNLVDHEWIHKILSGHEDEIKPCIRCHNGCFNMAKFKGTANLQSMDDSLHLARCALNPTTMQHNKYKIVPTRNPKKVAIIGGGIGGMECALVLKQRGHTPVIFEKTNELGGLFLTASAMSFKENDKELIRWYLNEVAKEGIDVRFNTEVTDVNTLGGFDDIIVASGSIPRTMPSIPGFEKTLTFTELLKDKKEVGDKVLFIGGGQSSCEAAYDLVLQGKHPIIVEYANDLIAAQATCLANTSFLRDAMEYHKVPTYLESTVTEIKDNGVTVKNVKTGETFFVECDNVVNGIGFVPTPVGGKDNKQVFRVGDCVAIGNLRTVIWRAWDVCMKI